MFLATPLPGKNYLHKQSIAPCSRFDGMSERTKISLAAAASIALLSVSAFLGLDSDIRSLVADDRSEATIEVDATRTLGEVPLYIFGENLEHEHGAINGNEQNQNNAHGLHTGGIWAEMLRDRSETVSRGSRSTRNALVACEVALSVVLVVGDHGARVYGSELIPVESYRIPALFLAPDPRWRGRRTSLPRTARRLSSR